MVIAGIFLKINVLKNSYKILKQIECRPPFLCLTKPPSLKSDILLLPLDHGPAADSPLLVDVLHHGVGVRGQQVVHLVPQGGLTQ